LAVWERQLFRALSHLLDLCVWSHPKDSPFLPHSSIQAFERKVDGTDEDTGLTVGHLLFRLGDIGVIAEHLTSSRQLKAGLTFAARYDRNVYFITPKNEFRIRGIFLTPLGDSIARFYEPQWNPAGRQVATDWITSLTGQQVDVKEVDIDQIKTRPNKA